MNNSINVVATIAIAFGGAFVLADAAELGGANIGIRGPVPQAVAVEPPNPLNECAQCSEPAGSPAAGFLAASATGRVGADEYAMPRPSTSIGPGPVKVAVILPLSVGGSDGVVAKSMLDAAEMALAEFNAPDIQLLIKDDAGNADRARVVAQEALDGGAEIIVGPLNAPSVRAVGRVARTRNVPVIAFSTDMRVASPSIYLLNFSPESDVKRIVQYVASMGRQSYAALLPDGSYGTVVEAAFKRNVARVGGKIISLQYYPHGEPGMSRPIRSIATQLVATPTAALFMPGGVDVIPNVAQMLADDGVDAKQTKFFGTSLWDQEQIYTLQVLANAWYPAPDKSAFSVFRPRYAARYGQYPTRTATLAYDAIALVASLTKTHPNLKERFSPQVLTDVSGFTGIDGLFRFRPDGISERELAVLSIEPAGPHVISPAADRF